MSFAALEKHWWTTAKIKVRPMTGRLFELYGDKPLVGAEVGVDNGKNARAILEVLNMKRLYLIDSYEYFGAHQPSVKSLESHKAHALDFLKPYQQIEWIFEPSHIALAAIPEQLDFVYLDGDHTYEFVVRDIELYRWIVKPGGFLGGHDYQNISKEYELEVKRAVDEKVEQYGWELNTAGHHKIPDWWVQL